LVIAGQVDLARQLLHAEAENVNVATEQRHQEVREAEDAALPTFVEHRLFRLANDRAEELGSAAHVTRRSHGVNIRPISNASTGSNTYEFSGGDI
jgi:hypothetical protein